MKVIKIFLEMNAWDPKRAKNSIKVEGGTKMLFSEFVKFNQLNICPNLL